MLSEEALILPAVLVDVGVLALGIWEPLSTLRPRVSPRPPRRERRRQRDAE